MRPAKSEALPDTELLTPQMQQRLVARAIETWPIGSTVDTASPTPAPTPDASPSRVEKPTRSNSHTSNVLTIGKWTIIKSGLAVGVAIMLGWMPVQRLLATTSAEATINARLLTIRAPIEGDVSSALGKLEIGAAVRADDEILQIENRRADASNLDSMRHLKDRLETDVRALEERKRVLVQNRDRLDVQQERFRIGRIEQLEQRISEIDAEITSAQAQHVLDEKALQRATELKSKSLITTANFEKVLRDEAVSRAVWTGVLGRRKGSMVEVEAARKGTYIGDSYNDTPQSAQRGNDMSLELSDIDVRISGAQSELRDVLTDLGKEEVRHKEREDAVIRAPMSGRLWAVFTAPGEHVNAGQDLFRLLDCSNPIVTASVSESTYQELRVGQLATFKLRRGGKELSGSIVALNGLAAISTNNAIEQKSLAREPYHVSLKFPDLMGADECQLGYSGIVKFDTARSASLTEAAPKSASIEPAALAALGL